MTRPHPHISPLVGEAILVRMAEGHMTLGEVLEEAVDHVLAELLRREAEGGSECGSVAAPERQAAQG